MAERTTPRTFDLGGITVTLLRGGGLKLDGGAMFGIIPKPLWTRSTPADDQNRIELACNCLLVEWGGESGRRAIVEVGHGPKYAEKEQKIFAIDPANWLRPTLLANDIDPASITDVIVTHLHFDHAGGLTWEDGEQLVPTFPNAMVHVQEREFDDARANFGIMTTTYREDNFTPIDDAAKWNLLRGEVEILPGVSALVTPGHTRGHHSIVIQGKDGDIVYGGDTMPTAAHAGPPYNMGYDLYPIDNRESKWKLLHRVADRDALLVIDHEVNTPVVQVFSDQEWFRIEPA